MDSRTYLWLGYTVMAVIVFLTIFSAISRRADQDINEDLFSADLAGFEQTLFISDYNTTLIYEIGEKYEVLFEDKCTISVGKSGSPVFAGAKAYCSPDGYLSIAYPSSSLSSEKIQLVKTENLLEVSEYES